jgi:hypothetical protein
MSYHAVINESEWAEAVDPFYRGQALIWRTAEIVQALDEREYLTVVDKVDMVIEFRLHRLSPVLKGGQALFLGTSLSLAKKHEGCVGLMEGAGVSVSVPSFFSLGNRTFKMAELTSGVMHEAAEALTR